MSAGFSTDGQEVINEQIGDEYDLLIAVFWTRLGTATPRSVSGSVEEYERAFKRYEAGESIDIAFLFKDAPIDFRSVNLEQIAALQAFELEAQRAGAFTKAFKDAEALKFEVSLLLDRMARKFSTTMLDSPQPRQQLATLEKNKEEEEILSEVEEPGLFDLPDQLVLHANQVGKFLNDMTERLDVMTSIISQVTSEMSEITRVRVIVPAEAKPLIQRVALGMNHFSSYLENNIPSFAENVNAMVADIRSLVDISYDFVEERTGESTELIEFRAILVVLPQAMQAQSPRLRACLRRPLGFSVPRHLSTKPREDSYTT